MRCWLLPVTRSMFFGQRNETGMNEYRAIILPSEKHAAAPAADAGLCSAELLPLVYDELRRLARGMVFSESGPQTLTATALVHEAWLRLGGDSQWENQRHFFGAAAQAMRRILVDRAREKQSAKRGARAEHTSLDALEILCDVPDDELLAVNDALARLALEDALAAEIVSLRYFAGLKWEEISTLTAMSERDLQRQWKYARTWLHAEISAARG